MKSRIILTLLLAGACMTLWGEVNFSRLTINGSNRTLFTAEVDAPEYRSYTTAFTAQVTGDTGPWEMQQLSFYPERIDYLASSGQLQIHNRFGLFRSDANLEDITPMDTYESFVGGTDILTGKIHPVDVSPDGRYLIHFESTSPAFGNLVLTLLADNSRTVISRDVELNLDRLPVKWSPESDFFIYQKSGELYYFSIDQFESGRLLSENFRSIGPGRMANVSWGNENELYYISGTLVYQILGVEFFTRSLYQEFLKIGRIVGKIPFRFDSNFDSFWISPDGSQVLLDKGGRNLYLYFLETDDYDASSSPLELPYLYMPRNAGVEQVLWSSDGIVTILLEALYEGKRSTSLYRLDLSRSSDIYSFQRMEASDVNAMVMSPDEQQIALLHDNGIEIRDYAEWTEEDDIQHTLPHHLIYVNNNEVIVAGRDIIERRNLKSGESNFIAFSRVEEIGYSSSNGEILVRAGETIQAYDHETRRWFSRDSFQKDEPEVATEDFRVYLESLSSGSYRNMIMVRRMARTSNSPGTVSLFDPPVRSYEPFPSREEEVSFTTFRHGSRIRRREVSLVFNAIDSVTGLSDILATLDEYGIRATFFLNGDFMRRHPGAVREIARSDHEVGSLFNMYFNMSDSRFQITRDFIRQGLAKNEDAYFEMTGDELSLLWHAPYYYVSPEIIDAGQQMSYTYIGRDVDSLDWVPTRDDNGISRLYFPSAQLVERIIEQKKPGSIVSMTVGEPGDDRAHGGREDYLFNNLDILINNLLERGYSMVPVSTLMDHAK